MQFNLVCVGVVMMVGYISTGYPVFQVMLFIGAVLVAALLGVFVVHTYFYSYVVFLLFMSGVVIMFLYLCGILVIEKILVSYKSYIFGLMGVFSLAGLMFDLGVGIEAGTHLTFVNVDYAELCELIKFMSYPFNLMSVFFMFYLFLCLMIVYEIVKKCSGPLRMKS